MLQEVFEKQRITIKSVIKKSENTELRKLATALYSSIPYNSIKEFDPEYLFASAKSTFELLNNKKPKEHKINICILKGFDDTVVLEVINDDIPFLVESISNHLKLEGFDIYLIVHPSLNIVRDDNHNFVQISSSSELAKNETIMQFHISRRSNEDYYEHLLNRLRNILESINLTVADWKEMRKDMEACKPLISSFPQENEEVKFIDWLLKDNFIFLGYYKSIIQDDKLSPIDGSEKGVLRSSLYDLNSEPADDDYNNASPLLFRKWNTRSVVHRTAHMDHIVTKEIESGKCKYAHNFLGFFTPSVYYQSVRSIPLIRYKCNTIINKYGYPPGSHNFKELISTLEVFPRGELIEMTEEELYETSTGIVSLTLMPRIKLFIREDKAGHFVSCLFFIPKNKFSTSLKENIERMLCKTFSGYISKQYVNISEQQFARLQLLIRTQPHNIPKYDIEQLEKKIEELVSDWYDRFYDLLKLKLGKKGARNKLLSFENAFDVKYTSTFTPKQAAHDLFMIEETIKTKKVIFDIYNSSDNKEIMQLKIFSPGIELTLSSTLPILEHLGFYAIDMITYCVSMKDGGECQNCYIQHFKLQFKQSDCKSDTKVEANVQEALKKIWYKEIDDDRFNSLITACSLNFRQANLLRAYGRYLKQINFPLIQRFIVDALVNNHQITCNLVKLFETKFDPASSTTVNDLDQLIKQINADLVKVKNISEDKVLRGYLEIINATKRTNYYQLDNSSHYKKYLSFKIASGEINDIPLPKPLFEIFVFSARFEAVHLRGGKVARGGIRWSDRSEDFRTEILGLVKAQMTKNAVIVPVGSKGGFIVKGMPADVSREELLKEAVDCYKSFLSGMLDITDNIVKNKVEKPKNVVCYDEEDPYLVVAADKGTATFSDYANSISREYGFWLGDAFASGGSAGYDHKKMGITAKGAWISVERHFHELGKDIEHEAFSVVGIGDMSGDVFGNGMLLSEKIKLVAAFNHMHIFLDPNPNPTTSYQERLRLFNLPRSQWSDYNPALISKGGGVYLRSEKRIEISPEAMDILGVKINGFSPDELIRVILTAPVDLLWNGGIGTYVKASEQSNDAIGDKFNDNLRVNGKQLRCLIIGEGGNLGCTQLGRIEYAKKGGRINTDFIDNSAGVDCSDHEVNIKIAFSRSLERGVINLSQRDEILENMTDEVTKLVLQDNFRQTRIISIEQESGIDNFEQHAWLINILEAKGDLDRELEYLPNNEMLSKLRTEGKYLTRPEIAVLVVHAKNSISKMLSNIDFSDPLFDKIILSYFPKEMQEKFEQDLKQHRLKNEILATILTNDFINTMGCSFFHQVLENTNYTAEEIINAFLVVSEIFDIASYFQSIEQLQNKLPPKLKMQLFKEIQKFMERNILWFLHHHLPLQELQCLIDSYKDKVKELLDNCIDFASISVISQLNECVSSYSHPLFENRVVERIAKLKAMPSVCDIVMIANSLQQTLNDVAPSFYAMSEKLYIDWVVSQLKSYEPGTHIHRLAAQTLTDEIEDLRMQLVIKHLRNKQQNKDTFLTEKNIKQLQQLIESITLSHQNTVIPALIIVIKKVRELLDA